MVCIYAAPMIFSPVCQPVICFRSLSHPLLPTLITYYLLQLSSIEQDISPVLIYILDIRLVTHFTATSLFKDTINVSFPIIILTLLSSERGQPLYKGQNRWSHLFGCSTVFEKLWCAQLQSCILHQYPIYRHYKLNCYNYTYLHRFSYESSSIGYFSSDISP